MAQQYPNYLYQGIGQPATMSSPYYADYNNPPDYQVQHFYNPQSSQFYHQPNYYQQYQQYQYDPRAYLIMSNDSGKGKEQQPDAGSPKSEEASSSSQFYCFYEPCASQSKFFKRKADLERHITAIHNRQNAQMIDCEQPNCHRRGDYGFIRRDKMIEHMRDVHKSDKPKRGSRSQG